MNIYEKIQKVKQGILEANLKKTGENTYSNFKYYELADFLPTVIKLCSENKLFTKSYFDNENAHLVIKNIEKPEEIEEYTSPMRELELKGCNKIQALGGIETYQRRYLYMTAFDIVENDMFDGVSGKEENEKEDKEDKIEIIDINAKLTFGKYKGKTWIEVYSENAQYFDYLIEHAKTEEGAKTYKRILEEIKKSFATVSDEELDPNDQHRYDGNP